MRKLDKLIIALLILIIGFQSYANFRLSESIESNTDFIYDAAMYPYEEVKKGEIWGFEIKSAMQEMTQETHSKTGIFN